MGGVGGRLPLASFKDYHLLAEEAEHSLAEAWEVIIRMNSQGF